MKTFSGQYECIGEDNEVFVWGVRVLFDTPLSNGRPSVFSITENYIERFIECYSLWNHSNYYRLHRRGGDGAGCRTFQYGKRGVQGVTPVDAGGLANCFFRLD